MQLLRISESMKRNRLMQIQVHCDNHTEGSARLVEWVTDSVTSKLGRFDENLTRIVVHINDENGEKAGAHDKRCQIEARPKGQQPISVSHKADSINLAVDGAVEKLHASLTSLFGKLRSKRATPQPATPATTDPDRQDELLEEDLDAEI